MLFEKGPLPYREDRQSLQHKLQMADIYYDKVQFYRSEIEYLCNMVSADIHDTLHYTGRAFSQYNSNLAKEITKQAKENLVRSPTYNDLEGSLDVSINELRDQLANSNELVIDEGLSNLVDCLSLGKDVLPSGLPKGHYETGHDLKGLYRVHRQHIQVRHDLDNDLERKKLFKEMAENQHDDCAELNNKEEAASEGLSSLFG